MSCNRYRDAIHELVDGTLGPVRRAELQTHLDVCPDCVALVADLQKIRDAAATLDPVQPRDHVWMQIAGRLRQEGRVTATAPARHHHLALLAMAAALVLAIAGSLYVLRLTDAPANTDIATNTGATIPTKNDTTARGNAVSSDVVQGIADELAAADQHYQSALSKLKDLHPETAAVIAENHEIIDRAIAESRTALQSEPQSAPAQHSLFQALSQKVTLLQSTIALMNEMRKGNSAGAAQLVDRAKKS
ncbi:MAG: anti-sigma factor [Acidobacteriota bacterium]|nr:zf-HC2 domain-containing protein [Acidobacteriota bacterium]MDQ3419153.1 anti-sigma factor [Acidobacteriota bacterium]